MKNQNLFGIFIIWGKFPEGARLRDVGFQVNGRQARLSAITGFQMFSPVRCNICVSAYRGSDPVVKFF